MELTHPGWGRVLGTGLVITLAVLATACGGGDPVATPAPTGVRPSSSVSGEFELKGDVRGKGTYLNVHPAEKDRPVSCDALAGDDAQTYAIPLPGALDEQRFNWNSKVLRYNGPGTYDLSDLDGIRVTVRKTQDAPAVLYTAKEGASATLNVEEGNTGSFAFSGVSDDAGKKFSGSMSWTCEDVAQ